MGFDFLGTFNQAQLERFVAFATNHLDLIDERVAHLSLEQVRVGLVVFVRDEGGGVTGYEADPKESYMGKLLSAYEVLGGNAFLDLDLRLRNAPIYRRKGSEATGLGQYMSNGEVMGAPGQADAASGYEFRRLRQWLDPTMEYRFDRLERKIRRAMDYYDQLQLEIDALNLIRQGSETDGSFENALQAITNLMNDPTYRAIHTGTDPRGAENYAPFSSYDINAQRGSAESTQRQDSGIARKGSS
jgi:hypothetical protein